jgi:hypothetical protein
LLRSKTLPLIAATALFLSACGGGGSSDKASAGNYASDICNAFTDWTTAIQDRQTDLTAAVKPGASPQEGKDALAGFLDAAVKASDTLVQDVEDAGTPDADNGADAAAALKKAAEDARSKLQDSRDKVDQLPTDSPQAFSAAAKTFGTDVQSALQSVGQGVQDVKSPQLDDAFQKESACQG